MIGFGPTRDWLKNGARFIQPITKSGRTKQVNREHSMETEIFQWNSWLTLGQTCETHVSWYPLKLLLASPLHQLTQPVSLRFLQSSTAWILFSATAEYTHQESCGWNRELQADNGFLLERTENGVSCICLSVIVWTCFVVQFHPWLKFYFPFLCD